MKRSIHYTVARGGLVKRGLLPNYVTAATVTNISYDHIGQNGIKNLRGKNGK